MSFRAKEPVKPFFACTFKCPVCGEQMEFEHEACNAKWAILQKEVAHLQLALRDLKEAYTTRLYERSLSEGEKAALERGIQNTLREEIARRTPFSTYPYIHTQG